jgi:hypothetical protein
VQFGPNIAGLENVNGRNAVLLWARAIADSGVPIYLKRIPANSRLLEILRVAYRGRGIVVAHPESPGYVTVSTYPTSIRGVSALASDVFHFGFERVETPFRLDLAA